MSYKQRPYRVVDGGTGAITASGARTNLGVAASTDVMLLNGSQAMTANMDMGGFRATNAADPSGAQDLATKAYVDANSNGLVVKNPVRIATTANITLSGVQTIDGVVGLAGDRVLVKNQTAGEDNGIYVMSSGAWSRSTDADQNAEVKAGLYVICTEGVINGDMSFVLTTDDPITVGTTPLTFVQFSGLGQVVAGAGLTKTGNQLDVGGTAGRITVAADTVDIDTSYVGQTSITTLGTITTGVWQGTDVAVTDGGTGSSSASGARSNLSAAPNTPSYWVGASNAEISNALVPSQGTGILLNASLATVAVDTTVVATTTNTLTMSNKTLNDPIIIHSTSSITKTTDYTLLITDDIILFNVTAQRIATLPTAASAAGLRLTVKNKYGSSANVVVTPDGSETIDDGANFVLAPGDAIDVFSTGTEWVIL